MRNLFKTGLILLLLFSFCPDAKALSVVYPKSQSVKINAGSTFFIGSVEEGSVLTINQKPVKIWENGSFVEVVKLIDGQNIFTLTSKKGNETKTLSYTVTKPPRQANYKSEPTLEIFPENKFVFARVLSDYTPLREKPNEDAKRLTHMGTDTMLMVDGKKGDFYRVSIAPEKEAWVRESRVISLSTVNEKVSAKISDVSISEDKNYTYIKSSIDEAVPFIIKANECCFEMEIFGVSENAKDCKIFKPVGSVKNLAIATTDNDKISRYFIETNQKIWGYDAYYENKQLVFKIRKAPKVAEAQPFKGITIAIDAGHGGVDPGAVGPTGKKEKDINFDITMRLKTELENAGAAVVLTRSDDTDVPLYDRPEIAQKGDALIMISIHANALPDGIDPYKKHGTSVFYYNDEAKELAQTVQIRLLEDLKTKDDGVCKRSFVLTRPTMPLSILIEVAYMIHPVEYNLLLDEDFRQKAAVSIKNGLEKYLIENK